MYKTDVRGRLIDGDKSLSQISQEILAPIDAKTPKWWYVAMAISLLMLAWGARSIYITLTQGIGAWGENSTVAWGYEIINFVWWIGIGHAGTAFSISNSPPIGCHSERSEAETKNPANVS